MTEDHLVVPPLAKNGKHIHCFDVGLQHVPALTEIVNDAILNGTAYYECEAKSELDLVRWLELQQKLGFPVKGVSLECRDAIDLATNTTCLGYGSFGPFRPQAAFSTSVEHSIYIHPSARGLGLGAFLLKTLIDLAQSDGFAAMVGAIDGDNKVSCQLHESMGFEHVGTMNRIARKNGQWLNLWWYQLSLSDTGGAGA